MYGRKVVLQVALVIFLAGSALCGLAQGMTELIAFRAIQGLGGGGLMVSRAGGDRRRRAAERARQVVRPVRRRLRRSSIAGPLIGGFLTSSVSWRWIFYVNLPLGAIALVVLAATLPSVTERVKHAIDVSGTALLAVVARVAGAAHDARRDLLRMGLAVHHRPRGAGDRRVALFAARRAPRHRADPAAAPVPQPRVRDLRARSASSSASRCSAR